VPLILADQWMPGTTGIELLARARELHPTARRGLLISWGDRSATAPILAATALGQIEFYLPKPSWSPDEEFHLALTASLAEWWRLQGGRYDDLLGRYGRRSPAVGFAIDVEAAAAVLEAATPAPGGKPPSDGPPAGTAGVLVVGAPAAAAARAAELRARGQLAAPLLVAMGRSEAEAYGARWGYREVIDAGGVEPVVASAARKQKTKKTKNGQAPGRAISHPVSHASRTRKG